MNREWKKFYLGEKVFLFEGKFNFFGGSSFYWGPKNPTLKKRLSPIKFAWQIDLEGSLKDESKTVNQKKIFQGIFDFLGK